MLLIYLKMISEIVDHIAKYMCIILGSIILLVMNINILSRYLANHSFYWAEELSKHSMVALAFIGASVCIKRESLVRLVFFQNVLSYKHKKILNYIIKIAMIIFIIMFLYNGFKTLPAYSKMKSAATNISLLWPISGQIIGGIFILIQLLNSFFHDLNIAKKFTKLGDN